MLFGGALEKLNILRHSERELILKNEQRIAVENLLLGRDVERSGHHFAFPSFVSGQTVAFLRFGTTLTRTNSCRLLSVNSARNIVFTVRKNFVFFMRSLFVC